MDKKEEIYPKGFPRQTESFSEAQKFKFDVYEALKEVALETTEKAFEDKGYSKKEGRAGEYGTGENYGAGTELNHFNIRLSSKPNTNTYFEKIIYFGGKETVSDISIGWDTKNKVIQLAYKTSEFGAFRGYGSKVGAHLVNERTNLVIKSIPEFKKEIKKLFKSYAEKEVAQITSTKIGIEDKTEKSINSMVENMKKNKLTLSNLFSSSLEELSNKVDGYISEAKKEKEEKSDKKNQNKEKLRMNNPEVVAANSKGKLLFDDLSEIEEGEYKEYFSDRMKKFGAKKPGELKPSEWAEINLGWKSQEEKKLSEIATAGSAGVGAVGGAPVDGTVGTAGNFKYAANPFEMGTGIMKRAFADTHYAKGKKKRASMKREFTSETSAPYNYTVGLNKGSGYVPKGMEHNYVQGQHSANIKESMENTNKKSEDSKLLKESLVKRKFALNEVNEKEGVNKKYIVTEKRSAEEEKERWKRLSMMETSETIHKAENIVECSCGCNGSCGCSNQEEEYVTMDQGQEENEQEFMQRNQDAESGEMIDGKEVIIVAKPNSLSNAMYKVFKNDFMNENKAYILDMTSGNLVNNPNFKPEKGLTGPNFKTKK
jgi:ribosomal protein S17E